jgi:signal transduction histidine kinase
VRFRIVDDGPGVPAAARERLFLPFSCAEVAPGRAIQGTGLGLFVCRRLVEQLGGTIGYEPGQERGSVFWFDQVRTTAAAAQREPMIAPTGAPAR